MDDNRGSRQPNSHVQALMLTAVIDAQENCDVCVVDIPFAFVQTPNMNEDHPPDLMKVKGKVVGSVPSLPR
jgi:hypothetical protein